MTKMKLCGAIPKDKVTTYGFKLFSTESLEELYDYINTHAILPASFKGGHRKGDNISKILPYFRVDVDKQNEHQKVDKALQDIYYIKKPSSSNLSKGQDYKWHYIIPIDGAIPQTIDEYKLAYYKFCAKYGITDRVDLSLCSPVQNLAPAGKDGISQTTENKGDVYVAEKVSVPAPKEYEHIESDWSEEDVKKVLVRIKPEDCDYLTWWKVGAALYSFSPQPGVQLFKEWSKGFGEDYNELEIDDKWNDYDKELNGDVTMGTLVELAGMKREEDFFSDCESEEEKKESPTDILSLISEMAMNEDDYKKLKNQKYLIDQVLPNGALGYFVGKEKSGKSWVTFKLANDALEQNKNINVIYFDIDSGAKFTKKRVRGIQKRHGANRFKYISQGKRGVTAKSVMEFIKGLGDIDLTDYIIFIDSLSKIADGKINKPEDVAPIITLLEGLRNRGACVGVIHHLNKQGEGAGSFMFGGSQDFKYMVKAVKKHDSDDVERIETIVMEAVDCRTDNKSLALEITDFHAVKGKEVDFREIRDIVNNEEKIEDELQSRETKNAKYLNNHQGDVENIKMIMEKIKTDKRNINHGMILIGIKTNTDYPNISSGTLTKIMDAGKNIFWKKDITKMIKISNKNKGGVGGKPATLYKLIK